MAASELQILDVRPGGPDAAALVDEAYAEVLAPSFGPDELLPRDQLDRGMRDPQGDRLTVAVRDGLVVGAAVSDAPARDGIVLLTLLAARPGGRSGGVGGALLGHLRAAWQRSGVALVLGEVHDPRAHATGPDEDPHARLRFYERAGAELLGVPWLQPAVAPSGRRVDGMLLVALHRQGWAAGADVPAAPVAAWAQRYAAATEGRAPTDEGWARLMARYSAASTLAVLPVASYASIPLLAGG